MRRVAADSSCTAGCYSIDLWVVSSVSLHFPSLWGGFLRRVAADNSCTADCFPMGLWVVSSVSLHFPSNEDGYFFAHSKRKSYAFFRRCAAGWILKEGRLFLREQEFSAFLKSASLVSFLPTQERYPPEAPEESLFETLYPAFTEWIFIAFFVLFLYDKIRKK